MWPQCYSGEKLPISCEELQQFSVVWNLCIWRHWNSPACLQDYCSGYAEPSIRFSSCRRRNWYSSSWQSRRWGIGITDFHRPLLGIVVTKCTCFILLCIFSWTVIVSAFAYSGLCTLFFFNLFALLVAVLEQRYLLTATILNIGYIHV